MRNSLTWGLLQRQNTFLRKWKNVEPLKKYKRTILWHASDEKKAYQNQSHNYFIRSIGGGDRNKKQ